MLDYEPQLRPATNSSVKPSFTMTKEIVKDLISNFSMSDHLVFLRELSQELLVQREMYLQSLVKRHEELLCETEKLRTEIKQLEEDNSRLK